MKKKETKEIIKISLIWGISSVVVVFLWLLVFLDAICNWSQGICVLSAFLLQSPAYFVTQTIQNMLGNELSRGYKRLIFITVTLVTWFIVGSVLGIFSYLMKRKKKK
jgi:hypothetical protein